LAINDVPIELWLAQHLDHPDLKVHGLSLMWLIDDMDFACSTLMTEQVIEGDVVRWQRFGRSETGGLEVGASTCWYPDSKPVTFALADFNQALSEHQRLIKESIGSQG
jgi:hypothetical protein